MLYLYLFIFNQSFQCAESIVAPTLSSFCCFQSTAPTIAAGPSAAQSQSISVNPLSLGKSADLLPPISAAVSVQHSNTALGHVSVTNPASANVGPTTQPLGSGPISIGANSPISISGPVTVTSRRANNTSVTMINSNSNANHRISVFEPYPMRDTVQHFCEKHLDKIKAYMDNVAMRLPPPAKCTIEGNTSVLLLICHTYNVVSPFKSEPRANMNSRM